MTGPWVCFTIVVGFYVTTIAAFVAEVFGKRCPRCGAARSPKAEAFIDDRLDAPTEER